MNLGEKEMCAFLVFLAFGFVPASLLFCCAASCLFFSFTLPAALGLPLIFSHFNISAMYHKGLKGLYEWRIRVRQVYVYDRRFSSAAPRFRFVSDLVL